MTRIADHDQVVLDPGPEFIVVTELPLQDAVVTRYYLGENRVPAFVRHAHLVDVSCLGPRAWW